MISTSTTLFIAPAAAGKTEAALAALQAPRRGRALLLVPDQLQRRRLRQRVSDLPRVGVHQFYSLSRLLLRRAASNVVDLDGTTRSLLLRRVLADLVVDGRLPLFAGVAHKPGFVAGIGDLIGEAQDAEVSPQSLAGANITPYDAELGLIYARYLAAMEQYNLADAPRRLRLARDALRTRPHLLSGVRLLVVDGFDQFTPLQLSLLVELARLAEQSIITLTGSEADRPAHRRFNRTRRQLIAALQPAVTQLPAPPELAAHAQRPAALAFLEAHLFNLDHPAPLDAAGTLVRIKAADREREVRAALRRVRVLLDAGVPLEQIAILFRAGERYVPLLHEVAREYALPLAIYTGLPLAEAPALVAFLTMLRLPLDDYPRRALVETWRCFVDDRLAFPVVPDALSAALPLERVAGLLERVMRDAGVSGGLQRLRTALNARVTDEPDADADEMDTSVTPDLARALLAWLDRFVAWITPPPRASLSAYVAWVRERMPQPDQSPAHDAEQPPTDGELLDTAPEAEPPARAERPWSPVYRRWLAVLKELEQAAERLAEPPVEYGTFVSELHAAVQAAHYGREEPAPGRVAVLPVLAARGACFDHVLLLGMAEGEFPLRFPEPAFYSRRERAQLARQGVDLPPPDPADERSLFYETVARARRSLTLAAPYLDESGNPLPASPYVATLLSLVQPQSVPEIRVTAGSVPLLADAASPQEALIACMVQPDQANTADPDLGVSLAIPAALPVLLTHVRRAAAVEQAREGKAPYGPFEGRLNDPDVQAMLAERFGPAHHWSITQLNDYITCPFRFAATHVLRLEQRDEPDTGLERSTRGQIYHQILAEAGKQWIETRQAHTPDQEEAVLATLRAAADQVLAEAPDRYGIEPGAFWDWDRADVRRRLERAMRRVLRDQDDWAEFRPAGVELSFGLRRGAPPLRLTTPAGTILVAGRIDRLDQHDNRTLALIDYKSSSTPRSLQETLSGRDVQLAIYLLAAEQLLLDGQRVDRAAFLHLGSGKRSKPLTDTRREAAVNAMTTRVGEAVTGARTGNFAVQPRDDCPEGCAFKDICRLQLSKRDAQT